MLIDPKPFCLETGGTILHAMEVLEATGEHLCLVVSGDRLEGVVTDGDIRRSLMNGHTPQDMVDDIMNRRPKVVSPPLDSATIEAAGRGTGSSLLPVVDANGDLLWLVRTPSHAAAKERLNNWVVIMAGGLGQRLRPITETIPKPMIEVGGKPILERILTSFRSEGFHNFFISVNYKSEIIKDYFKDGKNWGITISYLEEDHALGTVGALTLLPERPTEPILVTNGDLLTDVRGRDMMAFHRQMGAAATVGLREYDFQIPYGVLSMTDERVTGIEEKPIYSCHINAGIYIFDPAALDHLAAGQRADTPNLLHQLLNQGARVVGFPLRETWIDIGQREDLERARMLYT